MTEAARIAIRIAIVGAESTGKSTLAADLAARLQQLTGLRCTVVDEWLRTWCNQAGRTPRPDEQQAIATHQHQLIDQAAASHDVVVCDTTALMTAVYSQLLFDDDSLVAFAVAQQRSCSLTLLTALDIAWVPDGLQRDGPQVRQPVDNLVRAVLIQHALPWALVAGQGAARLEAAVDAVAPLLRGRAEFADGLENGPAGGQAGGLFTRLTVRDALDARRAAGWTWACDNCDVPDCEHALLRQAGGLRR